MAKAVRTVGMVVAVVALAATGIGLAIGGAAAAAGAAAGSATFLGIAGTTWASIGVWAGLASGVIGVVGALAFKPKFANSTGNPLRFVANPQSGLPYAIGRTVAHGVMAHGETTNTPGWDKQDMLCFAVMLSVGGAIAGIEGFKADKAAITFNPSTGDAGSGYANYMAQKVHAGGPQATGLSMSLHGAAYPGWTSAHKLSGITHALWMLRYDTDGKKYTAGRPEPEWVGKWVKVYDPRLDSTYPGGSGSCRSNDETTFVWSRNPALHALTWALGRWQNSKRTVGIGAPVAAIRVADFVEAANVADANGWGCGGVVWSTDSKWQTFKAMLQAGGAEPTMTGAMIGCRVQTPRLSIATITRDHVLDSLTVSTVKPRRDRINSIIPRYRSESHDWQVISGTPITVDAYVTADGGMRRRELDLPLVQAEVGQAGFDGDLHAGQLARYEIENAREAGPIRFTTGPQFIGLKCGDCVTLDIPEEGLSAQKVMIVAPPQLDPATGKISFVAQTETDAKHGYALGTSTTPPPAFSLTPPDIVPTIPATGLWSLSAALGADGLPLLVVSAGAHTVEWDSVLVEYRKVGATDWTSAGGYPDDANGRRVEIPAVDGGTAYEARVAYKSDGGVSDWRTLSSATTAANGLSTAIADAIAFAQTRGKFWTGATRPTLAESAVGDSWLDPADGTLYERVGADGISIGGNIVTIGGNRVFLGWTLSANQTIRDALATANSAYASANDAIDQLIGLADDGVLSVNEKITKLIPDQAQLAAQYSILAAQAGGLGVSTSAAASAKATWDSFLAGLTPAWNSTAADSPVSRAIFDAARNGFDTALADLDKAIKDKTATLATWSGVSGSGKPADNADVTAANTAAAIAGQGALATQSTADWSTQVAGGGKPQDNATVGAPSGTTVGSTPATTVETGANAANAGVNSDGTIKTDKVTTGAVVDNNITNSDQASNASYQYNGGFGVYLTAVSLNVTLAEAGSLIVVASLTTGFTTGGTAFLLEVVDGATVHTLQVGSGGQFYPMGGKIDFPAGTYTVRIRWSGTGDSFLPANQSKITALWRYK